MAKYITEVLKEINDDPSLLQSTYKKYGDGGPLGRLFFHAFTAEGKFILPDGAPPFKPDDAPMGLSQAKFIQETRKFYVFCRKNLNAGRRETIFVQLCENVHPSEAAILIAVKDQTLTKLYPNITRKLVADAGFIPQATTAEVAQEAAEVKKSARPRGRPRKSESPQQAQ